MSDLGILTWIIGVGAGLCLVACLIEAFTWKPTPPSTYKCGNCGSTIPVGWYHSCNKSAP